MEGGHPQLWQQRNGGKRKRAPGRKDQLFPQEGPALARLWLRLTWSVLRSTLLHTLVLQLRTVDRLVFFQLWNQVGTNGDKKGQNLERPTDKRFLANTLSHNIYSTPGDSAHVCMSQSNRFICPTANASTEVICDESRKVLKICPFYSSTLLLGPGTPTQEYSLTFPFLGTSIKACVIC